MRYYRENSLITTIYHASNCVQFGRDFREGPHPWPSERCPRITMGPHPQQSVLQCRVLRRRSGPNAGPYGSRAQVYLGCACLGRSANPEVSI